MWAGAGGCPGAVSERERDAAAAAYLQTLSEQNRNLQFALARYVALCARAADALEGYAGQSGEYDKEAFNLVAELRKAAQ
jgi:O-acetyl-ADP-ribose deacetylase (regulator of RNase III)